MSAVTPSMLVATTCLAFLRDLISVKISPPLFRHESKSLFLLISSLGNLKFHEQIRTNEKLFTCSKCEKKFNQWDTFKIHEGIHTGDKLFSYSRCDYKCSTSSSMKTHEKIHTDEKPFSCLKCDYKCSTSSSVKTHTNPHR